MQTDVLTPPLRSSLPVPVFPIPLARYGVMEQVYEIVSIRRVGPPPGAKGSNWHNYVIAFEGRNSIRGCRQGNLKDVIKAVEEIVAQLNERHCNKRNRDKLIQTAKKNTQKL